jgi:spore germination cell wall hydrolase CwlJ-like protein
MIRTLVIATLAVAGVVKSGHTATQREDYTNYMSAMIEHHSTHMPADIMRDNQLICLAKNIYYEARGESILGRLAVVHVTLNRARVFSKSICDIVYQAGQFTWTRRRMPAPSGSSWSEALALAWIMTHYRDHVPDLTQGAQYFHSGTRPRDFARLEYVTQIGNHRFYRPRVRTT